MFAANAVEGPAFPGAQAQHGNRVPHPGVPRQIFVTHNLGCPIQALLGWGRDSAHAQPPSSFQLSTSPSHVTHNLGCPIQALLGWGRDSAHAQTPSSFQLSTSLSHVTHNLGCPVPGSQTDLRHSQSGCPTQALLGWGRDSTHAQTASCFPQSGCPIQALLGWGRDSAHAQTPSSFQLSTSPSHIPLRQPAMPAPTGHYAASC